MNDGSADTTPQSPVSEVPAGAPAVVPVSTLPAPQLPAVVEAPKSPWRLPEDVQGALLQLDLEIRSRFTKLGTLEADYQSEKSAIMTDLDARRRLRFDLINSAAKKAGLDIDKARWLFDEQRMTLTRAS